MGDSNTKSKPYSPVKVMNLLYRDPDAPQLNLDLKDPGKLDEILDFRDYSCPFDTGVPLDEVDYPSEAIGLLNEFVRTTDKDLDFRRDVKCLDVVVMTYRSPLRRIYLVLIDPLSKEEFDRVRDALVEAGSSFELFGDRIGAFNALLKKQLSADEHEIIANILEECWNT